MHEKFTPSESLEAKEKKEKHDMGKEEAQYYHIFLQSLRGKIYKRFNLDNKKSYDYEVSSLRAYSDIEEEINDFVREAKRDAEKAPIKPQHEFINVQEILAMSPKQLLDYIDELDSSLIK